MGAKLCQLCEGPPHLADGRPCSHCGKIRCSKRVNCSCEGIAQIRRTVEDATNLAYALKVGHCQTEGDFKGRPVIRKELSICAICGMTCCPLDSRLVKPD